VDEGDPVESTGFVIGLRRFDIECFADEIIFSADPSSPGSVPSVYSFPHTDDGIARLAVLALKYRDALSTAA
jgi:hypothetical protein